jgi:hypothetical protein
MGSVATLGEPEGSFALALAKSQNGMSLKARAMSATLLDPMTL